MKDLEQCNSATLQAQNVFRNTMNIWSLATFRNRVTLKYEILSIDVETQDKKEIPR